MRHQGEPQLVAADGTRITLHLDRWIQEPSPIEESFLEPIQGPVLDVGCGPGRHVRFLAARGIVVMGIDVAPEAIRIARNRGASVLHRSVFDRVPGTGRWASALLLDGNIGIGGDPTGLLQRTAHLLRERGVALVELGPPGSETRSLHVRLSAGHETTDYFPWAEVAADAIEPIARAAGFARVEPFELDDRWFAWLTT